MGPSGVVVPSQFIYALMVMRLVVEGDSRDPDVALSKIVVDDELKLPPSSTIPVAKEIPWFVKSFPFPVASFAFESRVYVAINPLLIDRVLACSDSTSESDRARL